jgi:fatty acid desaturase
MEILTLVFSGHSVKTCIDKQKLVLLVRKYQVYLFYPIGLLLAFSLRFKALQYYAKTNTKKTWILCSIQFFMILVWYLFPFVAFPFWKAFAFVIGANTLASLYMINIFAPTHKGMPQIEKGAKVPFLIQQVITSRNIRPHCLSDYFYMGLNYQIEHHLFPSCPRNHIKKMKPFVYATCKKQNLPYTEMRVFESTKFILKNLHLASQEFEG